MQIAALGFLISLGFFSVPVVVLLSIRMSEATVCPQPFSSQSRRQLSFCCKWDAKSAATSSHFMLGKVGATTGYGENSEKTLGKPRPSCTFVSSR